MAIESPPHVVFNSAQPVSMNSTQTFTNPRRKRSSESLSLRKRNLPSAADPTKVYTSPPRLQHAPPNAALQPHRRSTLGDRASNNFTSTESGYCGDFLRSMDTDISSAVTSEESLNNRSNPEDWFTKWNSNARDNNNLYTHIDDPPYLIRRGNVDSQSKLSSGDAVFQVGRNCNNEPNLHMDEANLAVNSLFPYLPAENCVDDGFRGVIDDLTIKNQKLKKKLRKFERLHCESDNGNKLFEIRFHGLDPSKKQELEALLQQFATGLHRSPSSVDDSNNTTNSHSAHKNTEPSMKPSNTDSGYATESRGRTCTSISPADSNHVTKKISSPTPANASILTSKVDLNNEQTKMKLVVRRVEEIFTGRVGASALDTSSVQTKEQQILSTIAAEEDRQMEADCEKPINDEGAREAPLMSLAEDTEMQNVNNNDGTDKAENTNSTRSVIDNRNQRPTRPIDLDPRRESNPFQNMEYLNHITHSHSDERPYVHPGNENEPSEWLYLNLIINLAQLHTLNVSLPFIKRSINTLSTKLELSLDEKKVRWKGGEVGSRLSDDSDSGDCFIDHDMSSGGTNSPEDNTKIISTKLRSNNDGVRKTARSLHRSSSGLPKTPRTDKFHYQPVVVVHRSPLRSESVTSDGSVISSEAPSDISMYDAQDFGWQRKNINGDGPIIFFDGGKFCSDLSGQELPPDFDLQPIHGPKYDRVLETPLGLKRKYSDDSVGGSSRALLKTDLSESRADHKSIDAAINPLLRFDTPPMSPQMSLPVPYPKTFECSGIGDVRPEDNFMINVVVKHTFSSHRRRSVHKNKHSVAHHHAPTSAMSVVHESHGPHTISVSQKGQLKYEIMSIHTTRLSPSKFPSPSYGIFSSSEESFDSPLSSRATRPVTESDRSHIVPIDLDSDGPGNWTSSADCNSMDISVVANRGPQYCESVTLPMNAMLIDN